ncbi:hypothetical protein SELMODRAFT_169072 [Selaginella moellendorffii]|uniref:Integral membrane protein n=1 Tax=Selaginella moellendorffii TaxID=88036 RepID=D8R8K2_SELML|nr:uncharacterized protein LOC9632348 [Selaginella moellendorffii]EFJ31711.1 hypothetical protein SELMODRAFT_169072 [Selaginella moellendorffii]|eukprot:XP_002967112.1 uncharacterized protein LOC9632348 [Selaginella moellendorffii]
MALLLSSLPLLLSATAPRSIRSFSARRRGPRILLCRAQSSSSKTDAAQVYNGVYGPWSIDSTDVREVFLYRAGLVTSAATFVAVASTAFLPEDNVVKSVISTYQDLLFSIGAGSLGVSLLLIHIYVTPLKRALQVLWTVGVAGSILVASNFATPADRGLVEFVVENPAAVWAVGPLFAALTGLVFKEGLCYGKLEAALLFFVIPSLLLGHLSGAMDDNVKQGLLAAWMGLFAVFAGRKFTQPIKDDIGDKSIFMFNALPKSEQEAVLRSRAMQEMQENNTDRSNP